MSKSLINNVIKQNNLSNPVGRRGIKEATFVKQPIEKKGVKGEKATITPEKGIKFIEKGGFFFLRAADFKLSLTFHLVQSLATYFPNLAKETLQCIFEALIFMPFFENKKGIWQLIDKEVPNIEQNLAQLTQIPHSEFNKVLMELGISSNINKINELQKQCLLHLNSYVQTNFFPSAYKFLDFTAMQERFYSLWARVEKRERLLEIQFLYPEGFLWKNDIVWKEDLFYAANIMNKSQIFTQTKEQIWIITKLEILPVTLT